MTLLDIIAYNASDPTYRSHTTLSFEAIEYVENNLMATLAQQATRVITITDSHSDGTKNPINRIDTAIRNIRKDYPSTEFYAAGLNLSTDLTTTDRNVLLAELKALGGNKPSHFSLTDTTDSLVFIRALFKILETAGVLCPDDSKFMK
jgi:hypothetical protein